MPSIAWGADAQFMAAVYQEACLLPTDPGLPQYSSNHLQTCTIPIEGEVVRFVLCLRAAVMTSLRADCIA